MKNMGAPGWLSQLSVRLQLRSWSCSSWVRVLTSGSVLAAGSREPGACFGFCLSLYPSHPLTLCLSFKNKYTLTTTKRIWNNYWELLIRFFFFVPRLNSESFAMVHSSQESWKLLLNELNAEIKAGSMVKTAVSNCGKYIYWKQYISSDSPIKCTTRENDSEPMLVIFKLKSLFSSL